MGLVSIGYSNFSFLSHQEAIAQQPAQKQASPKIEIPFSKGYVDGEIAYFIATDASDEQAVQSFTNNTGFPVNHAPILAMTPESERGQGYLFLNGAGGEGLNDGTGLFKLSCNQVDLDSVYGVYDKNKDRMTVHVPINVAAKYIQ